MGNVYVFDHQTFELAVREITLNGDAVDVPAGDETQIRLRG
jgi:hypothetical protein